MKRALLGVLMLSWSLACAAEPPLPTWEEADKADVQKGVWKPGEFLLPPENAPPDPSVEVIDVAPPTAEELAEGKAPPVEVPEKFLSAYFNEKPAGFLVDPQKLLSPEQQKARLAALKYHASDSKIDLYLYLFQGDQEIPADVRAEEIMERFHSGDRPAVVVFYFVGQPQRGEMLVSPSLLELIPETERRKALQGAITDSADKSEVAAQLEAFTVQMSIRLYWMERFLGKEGPKLAAVEATSKPVEQKPSKMAKILPYVQPYFAPVGGVAAVVVLLAGLRGLFTTRAKYRFPEFDVEPRLGGAHGAGVGAVISFSKSSLPPALQKEQIPDYLRRA